MNFHAPAGTLDDDLPECWGIPGWSDDARQFRIRWFDAEGHLQASTPPSPEELKWIKANGDECERRKVALKTWIQERNFAAYKAAKERNKRAAKDC